MMKAIILAAGKGKRLHSEEFNQPKVLRNANGKSLISYVLDNINFIPQEDTYLVVGYKKEAVVDAIGGNYHFVSQDQQLGTGHAVMMAEPELKDYDGDVIVLYGDMPLYRAETYKNLIKKHKETGSDCTLLTVTMQNPPDYGRIIRDANGNIADIVEKKDCNPGQLKITELNPGVYVFKAKLLFECLKYINNNNNQKEYYLTDVPKIFIGKGLKVESCTVEDPDETWGVNTLEELQLCEKLLAERKNK